MSHLFADRNIPTIPGHVFILTLSQKVNLFLFSGAFSGCKPYPVNTVFPAPKVGFYPIASWAEKVFTYEQRLAFPQKPLDGRKPLMHSGVNYSFLPLSISSVIFAWVQ